MTDFSRKTYAPEIGDAIVKRVADNLAAPLGLKVCKWGTLAHLFAPKNLSSILPAVMLEFLNASDSGGESKLQSRPYDYLFRLRYCLTLKDGVSNGRLMTEGTRDLHDLFLAGTFRLNVQGVTPGSLSLRDARAIAYGPDPDLLDVVAIGAMVGHVDIRVRTEVDPH